jgi:hypothetical protein
VTVVHSDDEDEGCDPGADDPWLQAAARAGHLKLRPGIELSWANSDVLLEPFLWPSMFLSSGLGLDDLRSAAGLRTQKAEEIFQLWRQTVSATEPEAKALMESLEEVALCVAAHKTPADPGAFFVRNLSHLRLAKTRTEACEHQNTTLQPPAISQTQYDLHLSMQA